MSFGKWMGVVVLGLGCAVAARAQAGVYGMYQGTSLTGIPCLSSNGLCSNVGFNTPDVSGGNKVNTTGGLGGVYYDFRSFGPMRFGVDVRAGELHADKSAVASAGAHNITSGQNYLAGVRGSFHAHYSWLKPYVEVLAGFARSDAAVPPGSVTASGLLPPRSFDTYVQYEGLAGADIRITSFLDLRAIELGLGEMNQFGNSNGASTSSIGVRSISAGVVFHLP
jgi:hypothetical protein